MTEKLDSLFEQITEAWNNYFWEYRFCQEQINFTDDIKTNYYGDILSYFRDTMVYLSSVEYVDDFQKSIFQAIGILQIIYAQQDLMDELLYIFKLQHSEMADKEPNRTVRNELVGHPIRRKPNDGPLISSVYFGRHFKNGLIHYVLYARDNDFKGKEFQYHLDEIIQKHFAFVEKFALIIADKQRSILDHLKKALERLRVQVNKGLDFEKLVEFSEKVYPPVFDNNELFTREILLRCYSRRNEHHRYQNVVDIFVSALNEYLPDTIRNIENVFREKVKMKDYQPPEIKIVFVDMKESLDDNDIVIHAKRGAGSEDFSYEYSKLAGHHPLFGVDYFKRTFPNDREIFEELVNMENNEGDVLEFHASYKYLGKLLVEKNVLRR
jgi:hypothetical protein